MKIAEAASTIGMSADTIRFYERAGLLQRIRRGPDGHRDFGGPELRWLRLFERLRSTGMPLADMKRYADLARQGDETRMVRLRMLEEHRTRLDAQQHRIDACRSLIDEKIAGYQDFERDEASTLQS
jgi:DNA-binding transcriptional MerR regulator